ncbi:MAG: DivIVA domain-containing protein [Candidatus Krumholzibacteriia bacterium]
MRITPLDVRKQEFRRSVRGFECDEVRAFLATVADEYEAVLVDNKQLRERILEQDHKIAEYHDMERALRDTLMTAERMLQEAKDNARRKGDLIVQEAALRAQQVLDRGRQRAEELRRELIGLHKEKESYLARFRSLAESQVQFIENHSRDFEEIDTRVLDEADAHVRQAGRPTPDDAGLPTFLREQQPSDWRDERRAGERPEARGGSGMPAVDAALDPESRTAGDLLAAAADLVSDDERTHPATMPQDPIPAPALDPPPPVRPTGMEATLPAPDAGVDMPRPGPGAMNAIPSPLKTSAVPFSEAADPAMDHLTAPAPARQAVDTVPPPISAAFGAVPPPAPAPARVAPQEVDVWRDYAPDNLYATPRPQAAERPVFASAPAGPAPVEKPASDGLEPVDSILRESTAAFGAGDEKDRS